MVEETYSDSGDDDEDMASQTISTQKKSGRDKRVYFEKPPKEQVSLAQFMKEPVRPPDSDKWLFKARRMRTILIDDEVKAQMKEPHEGLQLKENYGNSAQTTEKTIS